MSLRKGMKAKHTTTSQRVLSTNQLAVTHIPSHHPIITASHGSMGKWQDNRRFYTICTIQGTVIQRNRGQLKHAAPPPPFIHRQAAVIPATVDSTFYPTPALNKKQSISKANSRHNSNQAQQQKQCLKRPGENQNPRKVPPSHWHR